MEQVANEPALKEVVLYKFTNQQESGYMDNILAMFYHGAAENALGIMTAWNVEKQCEELILVGVQLDEEGKPDCFPLAKVLAAEEASLYLAPNGKNGYYDLRDATEVAEAKDEMRSYAEAVVN